MRGWVLLCCLLVGPLAARAEPPSPEDVVRALIDAGNRADTEGWLALFHPDARQFSKARSDHALADRPSAKITDSATRRAVYEEVFSRTPRTRGEIVEVMSLGELVLARGVFHRPEGALHTLTGYRVRDGKILAIWDIEQVPE